MVSSQVQSFLRVDDFSTKQILKIFSRAEEIKVQLKKGFFPSSLQGRQVALVFSEASTRTKMSFQLAAQRLGAQCMIIDNVRTSSMSKGETFFDTFWTLHSIGPDLFIIRCGDEDPLEQIGMKTQIPVINAGFGLKSHPTQALLDLFTMREHFGYLENLKVLFVGDVDHSRVTASGVSLLKIFGAKPGVCGPRGFSGKFHQEMENFENLEEGLSWCDVYMGLRVQMERHYKNSSKITYEEFQKSYSLNKKNLIQLSKKAVIMHPGPVNWGEEFDPIVQEDPRLLMWNQKENGVYIRAALMEFLLKVKE